MNRGRVLAGAAAIASLVAAAAGAGVMSDEEAARKREGWYPTVLPIINYSSDTGVGYGGGVYLYGNGSRSDPLFRNAPYFVRLYVQYLASTLDWQYHVLSLDMPHVSGSPYRIRAQVAYEKVTNWKYFGIGDDSMRPLPAPAYGDYESRLERDDPPGPADTSARYHDVSIFKPWFAFSLERQVGAGFKGMAEIAVHRARVDPYDYDAVKVDGRNRIQGPTLITLDHPTGYGGGMMNYLRSGAAYDTRDFEPAPRRGWYADVTGEFSLSAVGSDFRYTRETITVRRYAPLSRRAVLAARAAWSAFQGNPPFFALSTLGFYDARSSGLGGVHSLRGYKKRRFMGRAMSLANLELRYDLLEHVVKSQRLLLTAVAFGDGGRAFERGAETTFRDWRGAAGGGVRIAWNQATIINASCGASGEDFNIHVDFGHQF